MDAVTKAPDGVSNLAWQMRFWRTHLFRVRRRGICCALFNGNWNDHVVSFRLKTIITTVEPGAGLDGEDCAARQLTVVCLTCRSNKSDFGP
jgi:hypothetical protein